MAFVERPAFDPPKLDWDQIRLFLAVARGGTLAAAAVRLGLDVSTVSRRLDRLEDDMGASLFERARDGTLPTSAAEQMLPHAEEMERAMHSFTAAVAQVERVVEGVVRITVMPGVADNFVAPELAALHRLYPKLVIELDASISYADLTRREADIAIRTSRPTSGDLIATKLTTTRGAPMTSPAYSAELGKLRTLEDARWIAWGDDLAHIPAAKWLREQAPNVVPVLRTSHFASQISAALTGLGVMLAAEPFEARGLALVKPARGLSGAWSALPTEELWLVGHRALRQVPRIAAVWDFIAERISAAARATERPKRVVAKSNGRARTP